MKHSKILLKVERKALISLPQTWNQKMEIIRHCNVLFKILWKFCYCLSHSEEKVFIHDLHFMINIFNYNLNVLCAFDKHDIEI